ncbi:MAG: HNH endonuclease signature motif containing protein [Chloroflexota bacterium]|nr:HNH endonuclease signature motif containing protein [Chloroflexota bacterium]
MSARFDILSDFLNNQMRMSHIYQPVMLMHLLECGGQSDVTDIAKAILIHDPTQIEYYKAITRRYPTRVLQARKITERVKRQSRVVGFDELEESEVAALVQLCSAKLNEYLEQKKSSPWQHRKKSSGNIPGSVKFEVLKNARHRCELCGIPADQKALEPDHIVPREWGGSDEITNLQALW